MGGDGRTAGVSVQDARRTLRERLTALEGHGSFDGDVAALTAVVRRTIGYPVGQAWVSARPGAPMRLLTMDHDDRPDLHRMAVTASSSTIEPVLHGPHTAGRLGLILVPDVWALPRFRERHDADELRLTSMLRLPVELGEGASVVFSFVSDRPLDDDPWPQVVDEEVPLIRAWLAGRWARHELDRFVAVSQELLWSVGPDFTFQRVNPRMVAAFGYREDEVIGRSFAELIHPDDFARAAAAAADLLAGGPPVYGFEVRFRTADGAYRLTSWNGAANPHEAVVYASGRDITEERRAARQREVRNEVLESIAASAPIESTLELLCRSIEEQVAGGLASIMRHDRDAGTLHPFVAPTVPADYLAAIDGMRVGPVAGSCGTAVHRGAPVMVADLLVDPLWAANRSLAEAAGLRSCWSVPMVDGNGDVLGTFAIYRRVPGLPSTTELEAIGDAVRLATIAVERDLTERRLAASEERLRLLADVTTDVVFDWHVDEDVLWTSSVEAPFEALVERRWTGAGTFRSRIHPDDRDRFVALMERLVEGAHDTLETEFRYRRADGTYADTSLAAAAIRGGDGTTERIVGGMTDISERRELERQVLRAQRLETIGALAGGIAHDLNNTLAPIVMAVELARREPLPDGAASAIGTIDVSARRAAAMVRQLLGFARGADRERVPVDPRALVDDLAAIVRDSFPKTIALHVHVDPDVSTILGDRTQLHQVLMNLAVNARDAMPEGGELRIAVRDADVDDSLDEDRPDGEQPALGRHVVFEVGDTGAGIAPADLERIFEPFFTTKPAPHGTGLGLSTSSAIVRDHGGTLTVRSELGRGSTFRVALPATEGAAADATAPVARPSTSGAGEVVLVVDDEPTIRSVAAQLLESAGYTVLTAPDGAVAIDLVDDEVAAGRTVDVVVTDWMMPVLDGTGLVEGLRRRGHEVPVIVISGLVEQARVAQLGQTGVAAVLAKPFDAGALLDEVHRVLTR